MDSSRIRGLDVHLVKRDLHSGDMTARVAAVILWKVYVRVMVFSVIDV